MLSYYLPSGSKIGVGYQAHYMANAMIRRGHQVTLFSPCPKAPDALYDLVQVDVAKRFRTFYFAWQFRKTDFSVFDVIHAHGDDYWLWKKRVPCHVKTMHGSCLDEMKNIPGFKEKLRMFMLAVGEMIGTRCVTVDGA